MGSHWGPRVPYYNLILSVPRTYTTRLRGPTSLRKRLWPCAQLALGVGAAVVYLLFIKEAPPDGIDGAGDLNIFEHDEENSTGEYVVLLACPGPVHNNDIVIATALLS